MSDKPGVENPKSFRPLKFHKRREFPAWGLWVITAALILSGLGLLISWLNQPGRLINRLLATDTPTPTATFTPTSTPTPTETPTITPTPTETLTPTPSAPFTYVVQENDSLFAIAEKFQLGDKGILFLVILNPQIDPCNPILRIGQEITVPNPGMPMPTATPLPPNLPRNTKLKYLVQPGDTLAAIAALFNSTMDAIQNENNIKDPNEIQAGVCLTIPVNLVTPTATPRPTSTPVTPVTLPPTMTPVPTQTPSATPRP